MVIYRLLPTLTLTLATIGVYRMSTARGHSRLRRTGLALTVVGALTSAVAWWTRVPVLILVAGLVMLALSWRNERRP